MGQINVVRGAMPFIAEKGSFALVSGVFTDEYMVDTVINQIVEGFTKAAAAICRAASGSTALAPRC
jgi:hypothetical protein